MRTIQKKTEPASLTAHRQKPHSDYGNFAAKDELRVALVTEQRGLCCYCMSRIHPNRQAMKIEHWQSQACHPKEQLRFQNLLGACLGGQNKPFSEQHCDTRKGNQDLMWNPANPEHQVESRVTYGADGSIRARDPEFNEQLNEVLGLNLPRLKRNRESAITAIVDWWKRRMPIRDRASRERLLRRKRSQHVERDGDLQEYCQVVVHWLDKKLARTTP